MARRKQCIFALPFSQTERLALKITLPMEGTIDCTSNKTAECFKEAVVMVSVPSAKFPTMFNGHL